MNNFSIVSEALRYIDEHLDEPVSLEALSQKFFFSSFYFHRLFSKIVGNSLAAYIRDRQILFACDQLCNSKKKVLEIALDCGFNSAQSFSRAFKESQGVTPTEYRKYGYQPDMVTVDELIMRFTNRLRGGILLNPNIIKREAMIIAGTCGDGNNTWEVWNAFEKLSEEIPLDNALSKSGYEIRIYDGDDCTVYVGYLVENKEVAPGYTVMELPSALYASFDVYVANGYDSENNAMDEWLSTNKEGYTEHLLNGKFHYCVEFYDERFNGDEVGSIVEIWIPITKALKEDERI